MSDEVVYLTLRNVLVFGVRINHVKNNVYCSMCRINVATHVFYDKTNNFSKPLCKHDYLNVRASERWVDPCSDIIKHVDRAIDALYVECMRFQLAPFCFNLGRQLSPYFVIGPKGSMSYSKLGRDMFHWNTDLLAISRLVQFYVLVCNEAKRAVLYCLKMLPIHTRDLRVMIGRMLWADCNRIYWVRCALHILPNIKPRI